MGYQSELISTNIHAYLKQHEQKELLCMLTCGSVDDGKSTLIGRLLHDAKLIYEDQLASVRADSVKHGTVADGLDLALVVDGLQAEREQGITIDVAYRYFSTSKRKFIIADTPGHEQYTRNMATGASTCDLAIILIDARYGVLTQTRRHTFIATLLGIKHIIVAINKMDLVDYSEAVYQEIKNAYGQFSSKLNMGEVRFLPISALVGDNVVNASENMPWYEGAPLMTLLETIQISSDKNLSDFRFPVQYVNRPNLDFRGLCGTIASGIVKPGDEVMVLPSRKTSSVKAILTYDGNLQEAYPPLAVTLVLEDEIDISRGDMLVPPNNAPYFSDKLDAHIVWMGEDHLRPNKQYLFKQSSCKTTGVITNIRFKTDANTLEQVPTDALALNEIGRCEVTLSQPLAFDAYSSNPGTGAFIIIDRLSNVTVGAGMIVGTQSDVTFAWHTDNHSKHSKPSDSLIAPAERSVRFDQRPKTLLLTGRTGAGKSTVAYALERKLFDLGKVSMVLDGENMRLGPSKDLGFDADARAENLRRSIEIAKLINQAGLICICAFVAPSAAVRLKARETIGDNFLEVYLSAPLEVCRQRDQDGRPYAAAEGNALPGGIAFAYEAPLKPELILPTHKLGVADCVAALIQLLVDKGGI